MPWVDSVQKYSVTEGTQLVGDMSHEQFTSDGYNKNRDHWWTYFFNSYSSGGYNMATKTAKCPCHLFMIDEGSKDGERAFIIWWMNESTSKSRGRQLKHKIKVRAASWLALAYCCGRQECFICLFSSSHLSCWAHVVLDKCGCFCLTLCFQLCSTVHAPMHVPLQATICTTVSANCFWVNKHMATICITCAYEVSMLWIWFAQAHPTVLISSISSAQEDYWGLNT